MKKTPVKSSNLKSVGFDRTERKLEVDFKSGSSYAYSGVHPTTHRFLLAAPSKGKFFWKNIRGKYPFERLK